MSNFKVLTYVDTLVYWPHSVTDFRPTGITPCPEYVIYTWCTRRNRFRMSKSIAIGVPFDGWRKWGRGRATAGNEDCIEFGKQIAQQNGIPWVKNFDPSWKLHDLMLMRLQGKV